MAETTARSGELKSRAVNGDARRAVSFTLTTTRSVTVRWEHGILRLRTGGHGIMAPAAVVGAVDSGTTARPTTLHGAIKKNESGLKTSRLVSVKAEVYVVLTWQ